MSCQIIITFCVGYLVFRTGKRQIINIKGNEISSCLIVNLFCILPDSLLNRNNNKLCFFVHIYIRISTVNHRRIPVLELFGYFLSIVSLLYLQLDEKYVILENIYTLASGNHIYIHNKKNNLCYGFYTDQDFKKIKSLCRKCIILTSSFKLGSQLINQ